MATADAIAISAAIVGAGLTVLGLVVAVASLWGISSLRDHAKKTADQSAKEQVIKLLTEEGDLRKRLMEEVQKLFEKEADKLYTDISMGLAFPAGTKAQNEETVGSEYPSNEGADDTPGQ